MGNSLQSLLPIPKEFPEVWLNLSGTELEQIPLENLGCKKIWSMPLNSTNHSIDCLWVCRSLGNTTIQPKLAFPTLFPQQPDLLFNLIYYNNFHVLFWGVVREEFGSYPLAFRIYLMALHLGITPGRLWKHYVMLGIEPGLSTCKTSFLVVYLWLLPP